MKKKSNRKTEAKRIAASSRKPTQKKRRGDRNNTVAVPEIDLFAGPSNGRPHRLVIARGTDGQELYRDKLDTNNASHRSKFFRGLAERTNLELPQLRSQFENKLILSADNADDLLRDGSEGDDGRIASKASQLVALALDVEFFNAPDFEAFATF